jgi:transposase
VKSKKEEKMSIEVSNLDHLGLVAGIIDEIGIEQKINQLLGEELSEKITGGQAVKGMLLNGLGLVSSPLYLFSKFFGSPVDVVIFISKPLLLSGV